MNINVVGIMNKDFKDSDFQIPRKVLKHALT